MLQRAERTLLNSVCSRTEPHGFHSLEPRRICKEKNSWWPRMEESAGSSLPHSPQFILNIQRNFRELYRYKISQFFWILVICSFLHLSINHPTINHLSIIYPSIYQLINHTYIYPSIIHPSIIYPYTNNTSINHISIIHLSIYPSIIHTYIYLSFNHPSINLIHPSSIHYHPPVQQ